MDGKVSRAQTQCIAAAGGLHHRYACKRSGDVIHPQLRCIGSGHETRLDHRPEVVSYPDPP